MSFVELIGMTALGIFGNNELFLALAIVVFFVALMFFMKNGASFAMPAGILLFHALAKISQVFQMLELAIIGLVGILFIGLIIHYVRG